MNKRILRSYIVPLAILVLAIVIGLLGLYLLLNGGTM